MTVHTARLQYNVTNLRVDGDRVVGDARMPAKGTLVIGARTVANVIEMAPAGFEKYLKEESLSQVIEWRKGTWRGGRQAGPLNFTANM